MISGFKCLPTLAGNSAQILNTFMSKFSIQTNMSQALQAQGINCIVNFPGYFAHQPFKYQIQGIPFTNEAEAQQFMKDKITWAYDAISKWSDDDQEFHLSRGKILDGFFKFLQGSMPMFFTTLRTSRFYSKSTWSQHRRSQNQL